MMSYVFALQEEEQPVEQMFYPQEGANTFITRIFVKNHATCNL